MEAKDMLRFESKYTKGEPEECWEWQGQGLKTGYGAFSIGSKNYRAHRLSYSLAKGEIPEGKIICHSCDNRKCVNPKHLWLGTDKTNAEDREAKGRGVRLHGKDNPASKLTNSDILKIRLRDAEGISSRKIAALMGVNKSTISRLLLGETWAHI